MFENPPSPLTNRLRHWLPWLLLAVAVVATAAVYWPGVTGGWVFDDYPNIVQNPAIHMVPAKATSLAAWVSVALSSPSSFLHRPLASITFALNWLQGGGNPYPFKVTNILIHLLNGVLLFCMLRALLDLFALRWPDRIEPHAATRLALVVAAAWLLSPINLMAVLYVVQRMESLCQVFVLAGLWAYLHGRWMMLTAGGDVRRDRRGLSLAAGGIVLGTLLGLTSKETAVLLPVFAFLAEAVIVRFARSPARGFDAAATPTAKDADERVCTTAGPDAAPTHPHPNPPLEGGGEKSTPGYVGAPLEADGAETLLRETAATAYDSTSPRAARGPLPATGGDSQPHSERREPHAGSVFARANVPARNLEPDIALVQREGSGPDKRIWTLFIVTLFIPAVLGGAWLLRSALNPVAWLGRDFTLGQRLLTEARVLVDYLHWTLLPNPAVLSLYHDEIVKSTGVLAPWTTLGSMLLLAALIAIAVLLRNRRPLVALGIGWFFAGNLLTGTIIPLELVYEQRMYFPTIGVLLAAGVLLLGWRREIPHALPRVFVVAIALLWFGVATNLRAHEWSNPLRQAVAEANRHPESPRAVYEAGRLLLIASDYRPGQVLDTSRKYLREAAAIPGASALPDQALIMIVDHDHHGDDAALWQAITTKLRNQPTRQEDISALISLTNCYGAGVCKFDVSNLQQAYAAALSRPHPIPRLDGAYADFQRDILHNDALATVYLARAVKGDPSEPAYRIDLTALYARQGETKKALEQIDALERLNYAGRLDGQIGLLRQMVTEPGRPPKP